jgi:hypothetical protein
VGRPGQRAGFARFVGMPVAVLAPAAGLALLAGGCGTNAQVLRPLTAESFGALPTESRSIGNPLDRPGAVNYDQVRLVGPAPDGNANGGPTGNGNGNGDPAGGPVRDIGKTVERTIRPPAVALEKPPAPGTAPAAQPGTRPPPATLPGAAPGAGGGAAEPGQFDFVGFVLMEVNGQPIYVDKVLKVIEKPLEAEAKNYGPDDFRKIASIYLKKQIDWFEREELEFAMAQRSLSPADASFAQALTIDWRQKQITAAGGSLELAKQKAAADGWDFEELTRQQYRLKMIQLYYQKRILPQVFVPRRDIWDFYVANKDKLFTSHGQARFRVIKIDPQNPKYLSGKDEAYAQAKEVIARAKQEKEDFAALARRYNDDKVWQQSGGYLTPDGWVKENALRLRELEQAAWKLHAGEVSDILPIEGAFYVLKLEEAKPGRVESFEDLAVQEKIREELRARQLAVLRDAHVQELKQEYATRKNPGMDIVALNMLMKRYPQWASAR